MKRLAAILMAVLLAALACLSFTGCGAAVEITEDNWQDYFEFKLDFTANVDPSGEIRFTSMPSYEIIPKGSEDRYGRSDRTYNVAIDFTYDRAKVFTGYFEYDVKTGTGVLVKEGQLEAVTPDIVTVNYYIRDEDWMRSWSGSTFFYFSLSSEDGEWNADHTKVRFSGLSWCDADSTFELIRAAGTITR